MIELRQVNCGDGSFRLEQRTRNVTCDVSGAFAGFTEWSEWGPVPTVGEQKPLKPEPFQINLGSGHVCIAGFSDSSGFGIMLSDTGSPHTIGSRGESSNKPHTPIPGEVYIHCTNRSSALVLMEQVAWVVAQFHESD